MFPLFFKNANLIKAVAIQILILSEILYEVQSMPVKQGDKVKVEYVGRLEDGTEFDSSKRHGKPLEFVAGTGQVVQGFDKAIIGMEKGQKKDVIIVPEEAYGIYSVELVKKIPRELLPKDKEPKKGMILSLTISDGRKLPAVIKDITDKELIVDLNHPLAGKKLNFQLTVVDIN